MSKEGDELSEDHFVCEKRPIVPCGADEVRRIVNCSFVSFLCSRKPLDPLGADVGSIWS